MPLPPRTEIKPEVVAEIPVDEWPWDWDFRRNCRYEERGRSLKRSDSCDSLLSDCLSEASRHHEREASSRCISPASSHRSWSVHSRNQSPFRPQSPYHESYCVQSSPGESPSQPETASLSQIDMWRTAIPGSRPILKDERPNKCPVHTCPYHTKGFCRKHDQIRHALTHFDGTMICGFCPDNEHFFERADVFKRHLTRVHSVEQVVPSNLENLTKLKISRGKTIVDYAPGATGECSICGWVFGNAQSFYEHLDDCVIRHVELQEEVSFKKILSGGTPDSTSDLASNASPAIIPQSIKDTSQASGRKRKYADESPSVAKSQDHGLPEYINTALRSSSRTMAGTFRGDSSTASDSDIELIPPHEFLYNGRHTTTVSTIVSEDVCGALQSRRQLPSFSSVIQSVGEAALRQTEQAATRNALRTGSPIGNQPTGIPDAQKVVSPMVIYKRRSSNSQVFASLTKVQGGIEDQAIPRDESSTNPTSLPSDVGVSTQASHDLGCSDQLALFQNQRAEFVGTPNMPGYRSDKVPSTTPERLSTGRTANKTTENLATCKTCNRFTGRPSEVRKHERRHSRPYGCTFLGCDKTFGSKYDWIRHENSHSSPPFTWRCDERISQSGRARVCAKIYHRDWEMKNHLSQEHDIANFEYQNNKIQKCVVGRHRRFWCGFCRGVIENNVPDAARDRFDHLAHHFIKEGRLMANWMPIDKGGPLPGSWETEIGTSKAEPSTLTEDL